MDRSRLALGVAASCCWAALGVLSLLPAEEMVRTGLNGQAEHVMAYAGTGLLSALAWPRFGRWRVAAALVAYAGALELGQHLSPGRHPAWIDWLASSSGALAGVWCAALVAAWLWPGLRR